MTNQCCSLLNAFNPYDNADIASKNYNGHFSGCPGSLSTAMEIGGVRLRDPTANEIPWGFQVGKGGGSCCLGVLAFCVEILGRLVNLLLMPLAIPAFMIYQAVVGVDCETNVKGSLYLVAITAKFFALACWGLINTIKVCTCC